MHLITITTEERKKDLTEIFLNTSNVIIICKVQTEIQSSRLISNKGAKKTPEAKLRGSQTYEGLWAVTFIHLPDGTHDTTLCSPWSWSLWWWRLHNSQAIYCLSLFSVAAFFLSFQLNKWGYSHRLLSYTSAERADNPSPSVRGLHTLLKIYLSFQSYHLD